MRTRRSLLVIVGAAALGLPLLLAMVAAILSGQFGVGHARTSVAARNDTDETFYVRFDEARPEPDAYSPIYRLAPQSQGRLLSVPYRWGGTATLLSEDCDEVTSTAVADGTAVIVDEAGARWLEGSDPEAHQAALADEVQAIRGMWQIKRACVGDNDARFDDF
jgi:hypothetical protein